MSSKTKPRQREISVVATPDYQANTMMSAVRKHFDALGFAELLSPTAKVVLKPNLLMKRKPEAGTTTHPALVRAVILWLEEQGISHITIADSPGGPYTTSALNGIYRACGMQEAVQGTAALLNYDTTSQQLEHSEGVLCREFSVITPLAEADIIINLPKLKTHGMMQLSAGVKNMFGAVPGLEKPELHFRFPDNQDFAQMLVDLSTLVPPTITVVDAVVSMEGDGPSAGELRQTGYTFAACDVHSLDVALSEYIQMPHETAFTVAKSVAGGLAPAQAKALIYHNDGPPVALTDFTLPTSRPVDFMQRVPRIFRRPATWFGDRFLTPKPVVQSADCIGCGKCEESCAPKAITMQNQRAVIQYSECIKCYCCHEMCPVQAIDIRRGLLSSLF